jgi:hypothetical protein
MKIRYKEDPRAWRKSTLLSVLGLSLLTCLLRWRHVLTTTAWGGVLAALACAAFVAWIWPRGFRRYYRFSTWAGFWSSQLVARVVLALLFAVIFVPAGLLMRLLGKDVLQLKRPNEVESYWKPVKQAGSLDRLF